MDKKLMQHGAISWFELMTNDVQGAKEFYQAIFGWQYSAFGEDPAGPYTMIKVGGDEVGGLMRTPADCPYKAPVWGAYVTVDNIDATAAKIEELGGKILLPPTDIPNVGRFCVFADPEGAVLSAITYYPQKA